MSLILEIVAVLLNLIYLFLLIKERISCWYFGISGSLVSIYLFYSIGLYSEAILYIYYVIVGIYGYQLWKKNNGGENSLQVHAISFKTHFFIIVLGALVALLVGYYFKEYTNAVNPFLDAFTTVFSLITSVLEAKKILSSWVFWIVINSATVLLYFGQSLYIYLMLTLIYVVFSVVGYLEWKRKYETIKVV